VNTITGLDEELYEVALFLKVLRSLSERFNSKVSSIEEMYNMILLL